jgi:iron complex outermembrane recepter protein
MQSSGGDPATDLVAAEVIVAAGLAGRGDELTARVMSTSVLALMLCASGGGAFAQSAPVSTEATLEQAARDAAAQERSQSLAEPETAVVDAVEVTGSRLQNGDVTSKVIVITEEEIKARGVTSVEELIRTLPQNQATIGSVTNERSRGPLSDRKADVSQLGSLGVAAANLGGMGAGNTLILVNGRRVAGAAGIEDGFANLNGIPLSAVERVEISLGGASAVYGSDAIGGVINFILKKDYVGVTMTAQHEYSSADADSDRLSLYAGYAWGSGSLSATLDYSRRSPINNYKTGYVTENYSSYYDGDPTYDLRTFSRGLQPGVISNTQYVYDPDLGYDVPVAQGITVRPGVVGRPTLDDMVTVGSEALPDYVPELAGPETESYSGTFSFEQKLTNKLSVFATGLYTETTNVQESSFDSGLTVTLAPGQYYNPYSAYYFSEWEPGVSVSYDPAAEIADGVLPTGQLSNTSKSWSFNAGLAYQLNKDTKFELLYTTSSSETDGDTRVFGSLVSIVEDSSSPTGYGCYNFMLANNRYTGERRERMQAAFDRQCEALTSTDPDTAFNPWKSTTDGGGSSVADFYYVDEVEQRESVLQNIEARLSGVALTLPAGKVSYVIGAEYNDDGVDSDEVKVLTGEAVNRDRYAFFAETQVPVFGPDFNAPFAHSLTLSLAARRDSYVTEGAVGTVDGVAIDAGGVLVYDKNTFTRTTPAIGMRWEPVKDLAFRARWSEGFQAPPYSQMFDVTGSTTYTTVIFDDPLYSCIGCYKYALDRNAYEVPMTTAPNPDLKPQTSTQQLYGMTWRPTGALEGLNVDVSYSKTKIENEYADRADLLSLMKSTEVLRMEQFYPRDSSGKIISAQNMIFNILGSEYESITYEVSYLWVTGLGTFEPKVTYLDNLKSERQALATTEPVSSLGTVLGVDEYKVVGSVGWYYHDISAMLWANYTPSYLNDYVTSMNAGIIDNPEYVKPVDSLLTFDLTAAWRINNDIRMNLAGRNIFAEDPPFVVVEGRPYDTARYNAAGRTFSIELEYAF